MTPRQNYLTHIPTLSHCVLPKRPGQPVRTVYCPGKLITREPALAAKLPSIDKITKSCLCIEQRTGIYSLAKSLFLANGLHFLTVFQGVPRIMWGPDITRPGSGSPVSSSLRLLEILKERLGWLLSSILAAGLLHMTVVYAQTCWWLGARSTCEHQPSVVQNPHDLLLGFFRPAMSCICHSPAEWQCLTPFSSGSPHVRNPTLCMRGRNWRSREASTASQEAGTLPKADMVPAEYDPL